MDNLLFDPGPEKKPDKPVDRCRHCIHMVEHYYNSSMKYCAKAKSHKTSNGLRKIKANDPACPMFERKDSHKQQTIQS